jgi:hypothetical protein
MADSTEYEKFAERFASAMSAWKFQVNSYWTRNSYFAVFETAAAAGVWKLIEDKHWWTSLAFSVGLVVLTCIWFFNNMRIHEYIRYWWKSAGEAEKAYAIFGDNPREATSKWILLVHDYESRRPNQNASIPYHLSIQAIPVLFLLCWVWTAGMSLASLACSYHQLCICK